MLINLSNHPKEKWEEKQIALAEKLYGSVIDLPFPQIDPKATEKEVLALADDYVKTCAREFGRTAETEQNNAVHVAGEFSFVCAFVSKASRAGIDCVTSTSERNTFEKEDGEKIIRFRFVKFRRYTPG